MESSVSKRRFVCTDCTAEFSRKDHAKRHKLSHSRPNFVCPHPNCGLLFHRRDVLRRHEAVHRPENAEKRRRPRRGPLPPSLPGQEGQREQQSLSASEFHEAGSVSMTSHSSAGVSSDASTPNRKNDRDGARNDSSDVNIDSACLCHAQDGTVCVNCSSELIRLADGRLPSESQGAINFCMTHYIQSQLKWFPFIRSSSLRTNWLLNGRALILAALGARAIKEYKALSGVLWTEAVNRQANWVSSSASSSNNILSDFQTKILLVEYFQWSEDNRYPAWVTPMLDEMVHREVLDLADMITNIPPSSATDRSVEDELCQQEIRWTLWKFYCTITRTTLLGLMLHPPRLFQTLEIPGDPKKLLALEEGVGKESKRPVESLRSEYRGRGLTLPQVLSMLLADQHERIALSDILSMTSKYIVLHAILYLSDNMVEKYVDTEAAQQDPPGWRVETRERLYLLVLRWRQCFWVPPEVLWQTSFPEFGILQSIMFVIYLAVRISQPTSGSPYKERYSRKPYTQYAMRCVVTMHIDMKSNNLTEVAAKGRWFLDGATWRTGGLTAAYLIDWFHDRAKLGFEDEDIEFLQSLESVMALYSHVGSYNGLSYSPARLAQLERSVKHLWTMILGTKSWLSNEPI
ncbi:hypothetical protein F5Y12DRAFT_748848 [Xylaria sp. FL1777]|nr:hypothetical protein F5Y12DRAFT_748848 [Xylaria sp. FL1777]